MFSEHGPHFEAPPAAKKPEEQSPALSRREALKKIGKVAAVGAVAAVELNMLGGKHREDAHESVAQAEKAHAEEEARRRFERVNITSAAAVSGLFMNWVRRCAKGDSFGPTSAMQLNTAEALRLASLRTLGGKEGAELAKEESDSIYQSLALVPLLITASDFTARSVAVHPEKIFKEAEDIIEGTKREEQKRPPLEASLTEWREYQAGVEERLITEVAELSALSTALSPFLTTYTSSAVVNKLKENIMHLTYEQSMAKEMTRRKEFSESQAEEEVFERSRIRTQDLFDGGWGFNNLQTTLAANVHGGFLLGDPPQIYGFMKHKKNLPRLAKAEAFGLANSELSTLALTAVWFKKAGIQPNKEFLATYFKAQARVLGELAKLPYDGGKKALKGTLEKVLRTKGGAVGESIAEGLDKTEIPAINLSMRDYAGKKAAHIKRLSTVTSTEVQQVLESLLKRAEEGVKKQPLNNFLTEVGNGNLSGAAGANEELNLPLPELSETVSITENQANEDYAEMTIEDPELEEKLNTAFDEGSKQAREMTTPSTSARLLESLPQRERRLVENYMREPSGHSEARSRQVWNEVSSAVTDEKNRTILETMLGLKKPESEHHSEQFLSHSAQEVLWALGSQIPCVEALAETVKAGVGKAFDLKKGERPSVNKMMLAVGSVLTSEAVISSLADNIAAYLYGEKVLTDMMKTAYGDDVMEKHPGLADAVYTATLKLAEQAGSLTKFGNGPNFSQERLVASVGEDKKLSVAREAIPFKGYDNKFANVANAGMLGAALMLIRKELVQIDTANKKRP